jgi:hypothetical protein
MYVSGGLAIRDGHVSITVINAIFDVKRAHVPI